MKNELYATLRERIVKVVPEIMELKFGCRFEDASTLVSISYPFAMNSQVSVLKSDGAQIDYETSGVVPNHSKILGRDITLADVLRAIESSMPCVGGVKWVDMASDGWMFLMFKNGDGHKTFRSDAKWELQLALHEQSDELGEWLLTILK